MEPDHLPRQARGKQDNKTSRKAACHNHIFIHLFAHHVIAVQRDFAEALEQLAVFQPKGRDAILADPTAMEALQEVVERGWSEEARECAAGALSALSDRDRGAMGGGDGAGAGAGGEVDEERQHIMMSCEYLPGLRMPGCVSLSLAARASAL